jgi:hypothetical protein
MKLRAMLLTATTVGLLAAPSAWAQATRTWISGVGDDVNPCSRTAPCKTFPGAIAKTAAGGEIDTLDPGGFGAVTVTKAMTLADEGTGEGGILVAGTNGIVVNCATDPNCVVVVRGLQIDGGPVGSNSLNGIRFIAGKTLIVENTTIRNFTGGSPNGYGVNFNPSGSSQTFNLVLENDTISSNGTGGVGAGSGGGVLVQPTGGSAAVNAVLDHVRLVGNNAGLRADGTLATAGTTINVAVSNSAVSENVNGGVTAITANSIPVVVSVDHSTVSQNNVGLNSNTAGAIIRFGSSTVTGNATAFKNTGVLTTYGNNQIYDNTAVGVAPGTGSPLS